MRIAADARSMQTQRMRYLSFVCQQIAEASARTHTPLHAGVPTAAAAGVTASPAPAAIKASPPTPSSTSTKPAAAADNAAATTAAAAGAAAAVPGQQPAEADPETVAADKEAQAAAANVDVDLSSIPKIDVSIAPHTANGMLCMMRLSVHIILSCSGAHHTGAGNCGRLHTPNSQLSTRSAVAAISSA